MKTILIVGADISIGAQVSKLLKDEDLSVVVNKLDVKDSMRMEYLNAYKDLEPISKFIETKFYDKPKSKFHK